MFFFFFVFLKLLIFAMSRIIFKKNSINNHQTQAVSLSLFCEYVAKNEIVNVIAIRQWCSGLLDVRRKFSQPYPSNESL